MVSTVWFTGYINYELNIFKDNDFRIKIIKQIIYNNIVNLLNKGMKWIITGGNNGIEQWTIEVANEIKKNYKFLKIAMILPFNGFGDTWNDVNKSKLKKRIKCCDYNVSITKKGYKSSRQFIVYQRFMLKHADEIILFYDPNINCKSKYLYKYIQMNRDLYSYKLIDMDYLELFFENNYYLFFK